MNLLIYSRENLTFKESLSIESFEVTLDTVINSESSFVTAGGSGSARQEDIAILHERSFFYIGIVKKISSEGIKTKISTTHFNSVLEAEYITRNFSLGKYGDHIKTLITDTLINSNDAAQNMSYLQVVNESIATGTVVVTKPEVSTIASFINELNATTGIRLETRLGIINGKITHLKMVIVEAVTTMKLRYDLALLRNLSINEDGNTPLNKVILFGDGLATLSYYLLTDGSVSTNASSPLRIRPVNYSYVEYQSTDTPLTIASKELVKDKFLHAITFDVSLDNQIFIPFTNAYLGDQIEFITETKTIPTLISQIKFKNTLKECSIILGEHRLKLTEKLKMIERRTKYGN
ncbi:MAG TPA: hypothetical protein PLH44_04005 [Bacilli bacterium]|nr:hypothetical protein [Bacilli bacterium]